MLAATDEKAGSATERLLAMGFRLSFKVERLDVPIADEDGSTFVTRAELTAYPERGKARRKYAAKGPARAEVRANVTLELFAAEKERGDRRLRDIYSEKCAEVMLDFVDPKVATA